MVVTVEQFRIFYTNLYNKSFNRQQIIYDESEHEKDIDFMRHQSKRKKADFLKGMLEIETRRLILTSQVLNIYDYINILCKTEKTHLKVVALNLTKWSPDEDYKGTVEMNYTTHYGILESIKNPPNGNKFINCVKLKQIQQNILKYLFQKDISKKIKNNKKEFLKFCEFLFHTLCFEMQLLFKYQIRVLVPTFELYGLDDRFIKVCFQNYCQKVFKNNSFENDLNFFLTYSRQPGTTESVIPRYTPNNYQYFVKNNEYFEIQKSKNPKDLKRKSSNKSQNTGGTGRKKPKTVVTPPPVPKPPSLPELPPLPIGSTPEPEEIVNNIVRPPPLPRGSTPEPEAIDSGSVSSTSTLPSPPPIGKSPIPTPPKQPTPKPTSKRNSGRKSSYSSQGYTEKSKLMRESVTNYSRNNLFSQFRKFWGIRDDNITDRIIEYSTNNTNEIFAKIRPKTVNDTISPIVEKSENTIQYNCALKGSSKHKYNKNSRETKYDKVEFNSVYDPNTQTHEIFRHSITDALKKFMKEQNDLFIAAYGQSGSGKSYLMLGSETDKKIKGIIDYTFEALSSNSNIVKMTMIPLQTYLGSVYNAFHGPVENSPEEIMKWFKDPDNTKYKIPEFSYTDILRANKRDNIRFPPITKGTFASKRDTDTDRFGVLYPPVRKMIEALLDDSTRNFVEILNGSKSSLDVKDMSMSQIKTLLFNEIRRPTRNTAKDGMGFNVASSRSHMFTIFKITYKGKSKSQLLTFADLGGLESQIKNTDGILDLPQEIQEFKKEKKYLVTYDLKLFRKMLSKDKYKPLYKLKGDKECVISFKPGSLLRTMNSQGEYNINQKLISKAVIDSKNIDGEGLFLDDGSIKYGPSEGKLNALQPSGMFNILRAVTGYFSNNMCEHLIFGTFYEGSTVENQESICNTTNTVLEFTQKFVEGDKTKK